MNYFEFLTQFVQNKLNETLETDERRDRPFRIYADIGDFDWAERNVNDIIGKKYGVMSLVSSNISPLSTLRFAEINAQCEIVVNIDEMTVTDENAPTSLEYAPVVAIRKAIEELVNEYNGVNFTATDENDVSYSVTTTFTFAQIGTMAIATSNLGKIVPVRFMANAIFVESGVSSDAVTYSVQYGGQSYDLYVIEASETMTTSAEGQTHSGESISTATIQEAKYGVNLVMPLTNNAFCERLLQIMHNGSDNTIYPLTVSYKLSDTKTLSFTHNAIITTVSDSVNRPRNVGLNVSFVDGDTTIGGA